MKNFNTLYRYILLGMFTGLIACTDSFVGGTLTGKEVVYRFMIGICSSLALWSLAVTFDDMLLWVSKKIIEKRSLKNE